MHQRTVFFISDGTGITAESLGHLLAHFPGVNFRQIRMPYVNTVEKVEESYSRILEVAKEDGVRAVAIVTLINTEWRARIRETGVLFLDVFGIFIDPLAEELKQEPSHHRGMSRGMHGEGYFDRMEAINFSLNHDDGVSHAGLDEAEVILVGVSRCGKTPTCLYLAMQFGIKAANYPLIPEDFERNTLPEALSKHQNKLFGLTITPQRLHSVRSERRPDSTYASLDNCRREVRLAEDLMQRCGVEWLDSSSRSIEEIATTILQRIRIAIKESYL